MIWDDEAVKLLKKLWAEGLSASQIANRLGDVTRNAVIGKVHRLGLSQRVTTSRKKPGRPIKVSHVEPALSKDEAERQAAERRRMMDAARVIPPRLAPEKPVPVIRMEEDPLPVDGCGLHQLTQKTCKWPIGDPQDNDFHFCGKPAVEGCPYCSHHAAEAYVSAANRKRYKPINISEQEKVLVAV